MENTNSSWDSYGKVYAIGHRATRNLFEGEVTVEEKVDGSQFSFGKFGDQIRVRSRGRVFDVNEGAASGMFSGACETVLRLAPILVDGWTYRGEVLSKPKHNVLAYDRAPIGNIIIWDIAAGQQDHLSYDEKETEAERLGLEIVPRLFEGKITSQAQLDKLKGRISILGGQKIEGYVVKNYEQFGADGKALTGKWVSEAFKEVHRKNYKPELGKKKDIQAQLIAKYRTEARWHKAVQHLKEAGTLLGEPKDIGPLMAEAQRDLRQECEEEIKNDLFAAYWKMLARNCTTGLAEWYKKELEESLFDEAVTIKVEVEEVDPDRFAMDITRLFLELPETD